MHIDWSIDEVDAVAFVTFEVRNPHPVDRRVRLRNELAGPVLPPRRHGVPEAGWDRDGYEGVVPADGRAVGGYACPAPAKEPPVTLVDAERADGEPRPATPEAAVRRLGPGTPPRDAVPPPSAKSDTGKSQETTEDDRTGSAPAGVESWLTEVEARVERAERLTGASVPTATVVLDSAGGLSGVDDLGERVEADAALLRSVAERAQALAARAEDADPPLDALRRLA